MFRLTSLCSTNEPAAKIPTRQPNGTSGRERGRRGRQGHGRVAFTAGVPAFASVPRPREQHSVPFAPLIHAHCRNLVSDGDEYRGKNERSDLDLRKTR